MTLVPSLQLGVLGIATSTCDLYGDGDAVSFPIVSNLIPVVEAILAQRSTDPTAGGSFVPPPALLANVTGEYCGYTVQVEKLSESWQDIGEQLVMRPVDAESTEYPFTFQWIGSREGVATFRKVMGPERWLPVGWAGCRGTDAKGQELNLCPVSCSRKMARGSGDVLFFDFDFNESTMRMSSQDGSVCLET